MDNDTKFMKEALKEAKKAYKLGEIPVGCVIVYDNKIIARGYNKRESNNQATDHAEIIAIKKASRKLNSWRLENTTMYITLEPCVMCSGAIIQARIPNVVYGAYDNRFGCHKSITNIFDIKFNHSVNIYGGVLEDMCSSLIKNFFKELREKNN